MHNAGWIAATIQDPRVPTHVDTLLFIPDISGFTRFVNQTEIEHSGHIISELLELIIEEDGLELEVAEVEGDAVFFYAEGRTPDSAAILAQAERMFIRFHEHLKLYESRRICDCGACVTAHGLSLKFVAHKGQVGFTSVRGQRKPYGPDVILTHRLLKNSVDSNEYLLATGALLGDAPAVPSWGTWTEGRSEYDDVGTVSHGHLSMTPLLDRVAEPPKLAEYPLLEKPARLDAYVDRPRDAVFELVSNLRLRHLWNDNAEAILFPEDRVNRAGLLHQCIVNGKTIKFQTVKADFGEDALVMGERVDDVPLVKSFAAFWVVTPEGTGSRVRIEIHYEAGGRLSGFLFRFVTVRRVKKALKKIIEAAMRVPA